MSPHRGNGHDHTPLGIAISPAAFGSPATRILVVEDDPDQARTVSSVLSDEGYRVEIASRGFEGLRQARETHPDLILMDVMMPDIDGFNVATQISQDAETQHVPILFVSAMSDLLTRVRGLDIDEIDFLQKPYSLDELLARVDRALKQAGALERLRSQVNIDELTGLGNLRLLRERLAIEQTRLDRYGVPITMVAIDVDKLKSINDQHGHTVGSEALRAIAEVLGNTIRETDLAVRYGGDEFVVLLPHATHSEGLGFAERVLARIRTLRPAGIKVTVSMGLASSGAAQPRSIQDLLRDADAAAYRAKRLGGDRACAFDPALDAAA